MAEEKKQDKAYDPEQAHPADADPEAPVDLGDEPLVDLSAVGREDRVALLEAEVTSLKDQLLRAVAETENVRRRAQRDREETLKYAAAPVVKDLLSVADNLQRALESVPQEQLGANEPVRNLHLGVEMTLKELQSVFDRHGIRFIDPLGERLDPHSHEAMYEVEDPSKPAGTVVQVVQAGYRLHDRLLRPARVGVAKGGPKPGAVEAEARRPGDTVDTQA